MILVLEDEEWRCNFFRDVLGVPANCITDNAYEMAENLIATLLLPSEDVTVYLDFDLDAKTTGNPNGEVAAGLLADVLDQPRFKGCKVKFIVHSMNVVGGPRIMRLLHARGYPVTLIPFFKLMGQRGGVTIPLLTAKEAFGDGDKEDR